MSASTHLEGRISVTQPGIASLLRNELLSVPMYQRSYSWGVEQLTDYWDDLSGALLQDQASYFLGTIVVTREEAPGRLNVVDGQQRLATTAILLAAIRDAYLEQGDASRAGTVEFTYLAGRDLATDESQPRLLLNAEDNAYFTRRILPQVDEKDEIPATRLSHRRMSEAASFMAARISETVSAHGTNWKAALAGWVRFLTEDVTVIVVEVEDESSAFTIFETLNDRGLDLTIADLVKNYLFSLAGPANLPAVTNYWTSSVAILDSMGNPRVFTNFLRHYWSSKYGVVRERLLFKEIRKQIASATQAVRFVTELHEAAQLYSALLNNNHEFWSEHGTETRFKVEILLRFQLEQSRPMLLAAMQHFSTTELQRLLNATVAWSVRGLVAGGIGGGVAEKAFSVAGIAIRSGALKDSQDVLRSVSSVVPSDREFETAFSTMIENRAKFDRYYLQELEVYERQQVEPEFVPNRDEAKINLEHILPRNMRPTDWPSFTRDELDDWLWRLGNLVLMRKTPNQRLGNRPFVQKAPTLSASEFMLTKEVGTEADWTPSTIENRQQRLANMAVNVWPRQP